MFEYAVLVLERTIDKKMNTIGIFWHISVPVTDRDMKMVPKVPE